MRAFDRRGQSAALWLMLAGVAALAAGMAFVGSYGMSPGDVVEALRLKWLGAAPDDPRVIALWEIRLPRIVVACLAGALLAMSGAACQGVFNNPLVDPYLLGVSAGAAFGAAASIVLGVPFLGLQAAAFLCALAASAMIWALARKRGRTSTLGLVLAGIVINSLFLAGLAFLKVIAEIGQLRELVFWLMGGLYVSDWDAAALMAAVFFPAAAILILAGRKIDLVTLGRDIARTSGVNDARVTALVVAVVSLMTAACVSVTGIIGWIGLGVPHFMRGVFGARHRTLLASSALGGAALLLVCDGLARTASGWIRGIGELPVTAVTSFVGAAFFASVLRRGV